MLISFTGVMTVMAAELVRAASSESKGKPERLRYSSLDAHSAYLFHLFFFLNFVYSFTFFSHLNIR